MRSITASVARTAIVLALVAGTAPRPAWCAWPNDLFTNVRIAPIIAFQSGHVVTSDGAGGVFVAFTDDRNGFGNKDVFIQRITAAGTVAPGWPASGLTLCAVAGNQEELAIVSDQAGGAIVAWRDSRGANRDIYAMRVTGSGTFPGGWTTNGVRLTFDLHDEQEPVIASDGASGAFVAWELLFSPGFDTDIYGARVNASGSVVFTGAVNAPSAFQEKPAIVADGNGGAILAFQDNLGGTYDIKAVRQAANGTLTWGPNIVSNAALDQKQPLVTSDGAGGALFAWNDFRNGNQDVFAQHFTSTGGFVGGWNSLGNMVCGQANAQQLSSMMPDGTGGAYIGWWDIRNGTHYDIYVHRILGGGTFAFGWPTDGVAVCQAPGWQITPKLAPDGTGGAIVAWDDQRQNNRIYASRVTQDGLLPTGWLTNGTPLSMAGHLQAGATIVADDAGGAILGWADHRVDGVTPNIFVQNLDHFGQRGDARPAIASVRDVAADQGGRVRMTWNRSYLDGDPAYGISAYWVWRQTPAALAMRAVQHGASWANDSPDRSPESLAAEGRRVFRRAQTAAANYAWEFVVSQAATGFAQYSYVAPTNSDSLGGFNPYTVFMVEARSATPGAFWDSDPDSGYSVDNLPPLAPSPFTGALQTNMLHLHWGQNLETDFAVYRLHRGTSIGFVPGPGNLLAEQPDTGFVDVKTGGYYFKLGAVDAHGNVSKYTLLDLSGTISVDPSLPTEIALGPPSPNPAREDVSFELALPQDAKLRAAVYDVMGRHVRSLADGTFKAGRRPLRWDGLDQSGRQVANGLYVMKLDLPGRSLVRRITLIR